MLKSLRLSVVWGSEARSSQLAAILEPLASLPNRHPDRETVLGGISARLDGLAYAKNLNGLGVFALGTIAWLNHSATRWEMNFHFADFAESQGRALIDLFRSLGGEVVHAVMTDDESGNCVVLQTLGATSGAA